MEPKGQRAQAWRVGEILAPVTPADDDGVDDPCSAAPSTSVDRSPTINTRSGRGCSWARGCATRGLRSPGKPSTLAPALHRSACRVRSARGSAAPVGSALRGGHRKRTPAACRSASSGHSRRKPVQIAQPRALYPRDRRRSRRPRVAETISRKRVMHGGPTIGRPDHRRGTTAPIRRVRARKLEKTDPPMTHLPSTGRRSVRVRQRSKITNAGRPRRYLRRVSVTNPVNNVYCRAVASTIPRARRALPRRQAVAPGMLACREGPPAEPPSWLVDRLTRPDGRPAGTRAPPTRKTVPALRRGKARKSVGRGWALLDGGGTKDTSCWQNLRTRWPG